MRAYRLLYPNKYWYKKNGEEMVPDKQVLMNTDLPTPGNLIKLQRIFLLTRMISKQSRTILYTLSLSMKLENCWLNMVLKDIKSLWPIIIDEYGKDEFEEVVKPTDQQVYKYVTEKLVKERKQIRNRVYSWNANRHYFKEIKKPTSIPTQIFSCNVCQKAFKQPGIRALHMIKIHNQHPITYYYINTTWCPICQMDYESITNVREHLRTTKKCIHTLLNNFHPLTPEELEEVDKLAQKSKE